MDYRNSIIFASLAALAIGMVAFGIFYDIRKPQPILDKDALLLIDSSDHREYEFRRGAPVAENEGESEAVDQDNSIRASAVAGEYYPEDSGELAEKVREYLNVADIGQPSGHPRLVVVPHAGHRFSGSVAAHAFRALEGKGYSRAILIGRSHTSQFGHVAADGNDYWQTPLGTIGVDRQFIERLTEDSSLIRVDSGPHVDEHSLEVEVPFLQAVLGPEAVIVPLLLGSDAEWVSASLARSLVRYLDSETVVVISSDLSHYPESGEASLVDGRTIEAMLTGDLAVWKKAIAESSAGSILNLETPACGATAIDTGLRLAGRYGWAGRLLKYANSGQVDPETAGRSVGYAAVVFEGNLIMSSGRSLNDEERLKAVQVARDAIDGLFTETSRKDRPEQSIFDERRGAFVTLRKNGELCGCIGALDPKFPLDETIRRMALGAATEDSRFEPLTESERESLEIEISVLTPKTRVSSPDEIRMGEHGVWIQQGDKSGVFLPQVAEEFGQDRDRFLSELCSQKAGLPADCWKDPKTELYVFTSQSFSERY